MPGEPGSNESRAACADAGTACAGREGCGRGTFAEFGSFPARLDRGSTSWLIGAAVHSTVHVKPSAQYEEQYDDAQADDRHDPD